MGSINNEKEEELEEANTNTNPFCFSVVSYFPLIFYIALITQILTTRFTSKGPPAKNEPFASH
jgi:hypothetical protein